MLDEWDILWRVALALVLGGLIGFDRERRNKPAGIRTHMLVAGGAALFMGVAVMLSEGVESLETQSARIDVSRIAAGIVTGVGFLGAGAIITRHDRVSGLTTAAGIWVTAAVGVTAALGLWILAIGVTAGVLLVYAVSLVAENRLGPAGAGEDAAKSPGDDLAG